MSHVSESQVVAMIHGHDLDSFTAWYGKQWYLTGFWLSSSTAKDWFTFKPSSSAPQPSPRESMDDKTLQVSLCLLISLVDLGGAFLFGAFATTLLVLSTVDFGSGDSSGSNSNVGLAIVFTLIPGAVALIGVIFAIGIWCGRARHKWARRSFVYQVIVGAAVVLVLVSSFSIPWVFALVAVVLGCVACEQIQRMHRRHEQEEEATQNEDILSDRTNNDVGIEISVVPYCSQETAASSPRATREQASNTLGH